MTAKAVKKYSADQIAESLDGFEEIAIEQKFHADFFTMGESMRGMRALAFIIFKRDGKSDNEAYVEAMRMPLKAVMDMFETEEPKDAAAAMEADIEGKE